MSAHVFIGRSIIATVAVSLSVAGFASAQNLLFTAREDGSGTVTSPGSLPGPFNGSIVPDQSGGLPNVLGWLLAFGAPNLVTNGDVLLHEFAGGPVSDVIRFFQLPGQNVWEMYFYSDLDDGADALGDLGLPNQFQPNVLHALETTLADGTIGFEYTPQAGQPGYIDPNSGFPPITYTFVSDIPTPGCAALLGLGGLATARRRR